MNIKHLAITLISALVLGLGSAWAQSPSFDELDRDSSGYISSTEAMALPCLADQFHTIEADNPEGLTRDEFKQALEEYCERRSAEEW